METLGRKQLIDRLMDAYVDWRNACAWVNNAYRSWAVDTGSRDAVMFELYMEALDAEGDAAEAYATAVSRVQTQLWGEGPLAPTIGGRAREVG